MHDYINNLKKNNIPIFEPNLKELIVKSTNAGNLTFVNNLKKQFTVVIEEVEIVKENIIFKIPGKLN